MENEIDAADDRGGMPKPGAKRRRNESDVFPYLKSTSLWIPQVENNVCSNVIYRIVSAISVSIPPARHALVTTVELKYLNCRHSNVRIGGIRDNNVTFYMGHF